MGVEAMGDEAGDGCGDAIAGGKKLATLAAGVNLTSPRSLISM
jgi:hypothetical protein